MNNIFSELVGLGIPFLFYLYFFGLNISSPHQLHGNQNAFGSMKKNKNHAEVMQVSHKSVSIDCVLSFSLITV